MRTDEDESSFAEFVVSSRRRLRSTAFLLCGDWDQASDLTQEGLVRVYVAWPRLTRNGGELEYARRAVTSAFLDHTRKRSSRERPAEIHDDRASPHDVAATVSERSALMDALSRLPPRQRACVVLRYFEDLDVRDAAAALRCSEGTVKSQTSRAMAALRQMLEDAELTDPNPTPNPQRGPRS